MPKASTAKKPPARAGQSSRARGEVAAPGDRAGDPAPAFVSTVAWAPREELDHRQWAAAGRRLGAIGRSCQWWIGDWIRYGTARWGEKYAEAARLTGYDPASLRNMAWVAGQFDLSLRSDKLTWSHHVLLAPLEDEEKQEWLDQAVSEKLSVSDLRTELRTVGAGSGAPRRKPTASSQPATVVCPKCGHKVDLPAG
jgi:hypothetical protein